MSIPTAVVGCFGFLLQGFGDADWTVEGDHIGAVLGWSVAGAGDVDGGGFADVILGAPSFYGDPPSRAMLYLGSASGLSSSPEWLVQDPQGEHFGSSVATAAT